MLKPSRVIASIAVLGFAVALYAFRDDISVRYHRWRFDAEYAALRYPTVTDTSPDAYDSKTAAIEARLATLVRLKAVVRIDHDVRLAPFPAYTPSDFPARLEAGTLPDHLYLDVSGSPRTETQQLSVWCEPGDLSRWKSYLEMGG